MPEVIATRDIYNENGVLLIAKGQKLTKRVRQKLWDGNIARKDQNEVNDKITVKDSVEQISDKFPQMAGNSLKDASAIVSDIIFGSKSFPWWIYVCALSNYIDWMYTHSVDVALISTFIAIKSNCDQKTQSEICLGALLHDVGKLLIPKKILQKAGQLDEQEKLIVRQHCELGYDMAQEWNLSKECMNIILQHHERLDGSGYPYGISGDEISEYAKIVMIADAFDAITSYRPYKQLKSGSNGIRELRNNGEKFAASYVDTLAQCMG
ncbi:MULTISPECIES: HD-GYP domain-containing protein [Acutalibacteraceae]|uniref:HD-GYP domain-containing protein n=1 Tax=Acutalibacteraceae TaxID=3082771 RepID=UPI001FAAA17F|nr:MULTISPECIES: HD domain-containing phosphohydrolase [Acutalibacteraceae]